ncbi:hypothetical protein KM295_14990 [Natronomonas sp. F2-12]|uniref:Uncharacterized protein n=1 Tax=Natronomonas aquatica TaxID=2841590 RepID=A0A9R1CVY2_9EURY|nr:hypothetical protein [Natronomonas aquatica]MCQ4334758.1 hypothetical protein [Natronomonas aquatica]
MGKNHVITVSAGITEMYGLGAGESLFAYDGISMENIRRAVDVFVDEGSRSKVRFKSVVCEDDPIESLEYTNYKLENTTVKTEEQEDHYSVQVTKIIERDDLEDGQRVVESDFAFFQVGDTNIWTAVSGQTPDQFEHGPLWVLKKSEPEISNFFASSKDLQTVLHRFRDSFPSGTEIIAKKTVAYSRNDEGQISWETRPFEEIFEMAEEEGKYIDKIRFVVNSDDEERVDAFISRRGKLQFHSGNASRFFDDLLPVFADIGQQKADLFGGQERSEETGDVNEIEISFDKNHFKNPPDNRKLIKALDELSNSNITVYHNNPYAHVSVFDNVDGSSCDVFITGPKEVSIVPSYRGSFNSLMRVAEQISRELEEGEILENPREDYTMGDFFSA